MGKSIHIEREQWPPALRQALESEGYKRADIAVRIQDTVDSRSSGGQGSRGILIVLNLETGRFKREYGSWGGANPFESRIPDREPQDIPLPPGILVIKGCTGAHRKSPFLTVYAGAGSILAALPGPGQDLTGTHLRVLCTIIGLKGGDYRRNALAKIPGAAAAIDDLVSGDYLKRNKRGSVQTTTKGRNARESAPSGMRYAI